MRAKPLSGSEESTTDPRTEWECSKSNIKILNEIEQDCYGKICKGSVRLQKDGDHGSVLLRILKGQYDIDIDTFAVAIQNKLSIS